MSSLKALSLRLLLCLLLALAPLAPAQGPARQPDLTLDANMRAQVIDGIVKHLNDAYVFPEVAKKMEQALRERQQKKEYDQVTSAISFVEALTSHLQEVSKDKHLRITYSHEPLPVPTQRAEPAPEERERFRQNLRAINFGFEKVERLSGNIGYLDLRGFVPPEFSGETAAAAMNFLANTDALIIDLRRNGGGSPAAVAFLSTYLFDGEPVHLNDLYFRPENSTRQWWTLPYVPGQRFGSKKDVYILTANRTFSAAEEFTYNLKNLKRATIVGETTGGGAHPGGPRRINDHFAVWVPSGRAINPISKTNWEGTGVTPDIAVPADHALKTAHLAAVKKVLEKTTDPRHAEQLKGLVNTLQQEVEALKNPSAAKSPTAPAAPSVDLTVEGFTFPNTPIARTVAVFLRAINTGNLATLRQFHTERGAEDAAGNAQQDLNFYNQSGGLKPHSVVRATDYEIEFLGQAKKDGRWLKVGIEIEHTAPHRLADIRIQPTSAPTAAPAASAPAKKLSEPEMLKELADFIQQRVAADQFSGTVLVAKQDKPIFQQAYGLAHQSRKLPNRLDTKFNLGSMNKMFTAVAIAQLAEQGKLSFEDKVGRHLPDYPNQAVAEKVTIHHLLTHTSGLGHYWNKKFEQQKDEIRTVADYLALFVDEPLAFEPGAKFHYSNSGFIVLGAIIEKVSGQNYFAYVHEHIFKPAGMTDSAYYESKQETQNLAMGYTRARENEESTPAARQENTNTRPKRGGPAGGGYSTVLDLLKFQQALREHKLLSPKSTALITTGKVKTGGGQYGYGFITGERNGHRYFGHNGGAPGMAANLTVLPDLGYTIAVMGNYDPRYIMPVVDKIEALLMQRQ